MKEMNKKMKVPGTIGGNVVKDEMNMHMVYYFQD